jgi:hypothetical protein
MTEHLITVEIADQTGHTTLQLTAAETADVLQQNADAWVFANDRLVQPNELANADFAAIDTVRIVPGLVGGS